MRSTAAIQSRKSRDLVSLCVRTLLISFGTVVMGSPRGFTLFLGLRAIALALRAGSRFAPKFLLLFERNLIINLSDHQMIKLFDH